MGEYQLGVVIEKDEDGYYAYCPSLDGCFAQGETYEQAMQNIQSAVELHIQDRLALAQEIPQAQMSSFSMIHYIPSRGVQKIQG